MHHCLSEFCDRDLHSYLKFQLFYFNCHIGLNISILGTLIPSCDEPMCSHVGGLKVSSWPLTYFSHYDFYFQI